MLEFYNSLPVAFKILLNVLAYGLSVTIIISAIYQIPVRNHKLKRDLVDAEKELTRISVQRKKAQDDYVELMREHDKERSALIGDLGKLREEINLLEQEKKELNIEIVSLKAKIGGRPKGSTSKGNSTK